ncbi:MAG: hypothetical protein GX225_03145 [Clostridiales bacterium]|nr:hypothetical protein [Clostridiales bacterium]
MVTTSAGNNQSQEERVQKDYRGSDKRSSRNEGQRDRKDERSGSDRPREYKPRDSRQGDNNKSRDNRGSGDYKPRENRGNGDYKPRENRDYKPRENRGSGDYKPRENRGTGDYKPRDNRGNGNYKPRGEYKGTGEYKPREFKSNDNGGYRRNSGGFSKGFDKDKDDDVRRTSRPAARDSKPKEQTSDKFEIINRLEKEKKAMKKKQVEGRKEFKPVKHQAKPKRVGNIDWTREYENGSYDDDDLDIYL